MHLVSGLSKRLSIDRSHVAIGVFDGVHRGHQKLISKLVESAHAVGSTAVVLTFDPHPAVGLGREEPLLLTTVEERIELLADLGLDTTVTLPFTADVARMAAADFVDLLTTNLCMTDLWSSEGFALGQDRTGDADFLRQLGKQLGYDLHLVEPEIWEGVRVSSSRIRTALLAGDLDQATGCLGRPFQLRGEVIRGDGRGRLFGIRTANLALTPKRLIPLNGIYACIAHTERFGSYTAVTNVGTRPSFPGDQRLVEAHLLDFCGDLYGQVLAIDFHTRLRDELRFVSTERLIAQIDQDIAQARSILEDVL